MLKFIAAVILVAGAAMMTLETQAAEAVCTLDGTPVPGFAVASIGDERFQALHRKSAPRGDRERWAEIPWQTDLPAARRKAAEEKKPLLMWIMDGHPLGCT